MVGTHLVAELSRRGHEIWALARDVEQAYTRIPQARRILQWEASKSLDPKALSGVNAVVHLAGAPLVPNVFTKKGRQKIYGSRVLGLRKIVDTIVSKPNHSVDVVVSASAVGYYGDCGDDLISEEAKAGQDFLANVCVNWERELLQRKDLSSRTVSLRCGLILNKGQGLLKFLEPIFKTGLGSILGSGEQWISWIHIEDAIRAYVFALENPVVTGPVNACSQKPVHNMDFSVLLGDALHRPVLIKTPPWLLRSLPGPTEELFLFSQRAMPGVLLANRFKFHYPSLYEAFTDLYGKDTTPKKKTHALPDLVSANEDREEHYDLDGTSHSHGQIYIASGIY